MILNSGKIAGAESEIVVTGQELADTAVELRADSFSASSKGQVGESKEIFRDWQLGPLSNPFRCCSLFTSSVYS